jgi:hypothetical protein
MAIQKVLIQEPRLSSPQAAGPSAGKRVSGGSPRQVLNDFLRAQAINTSQHIIGLRPFRLDEFGTRATSPSAPQVQAVNQLIEKLGVRLKMLGQQLGQSSHISAASPTSQHLNSLLSQKDQAIRLAKFIEKVWNFYFELFGQRQSQVARWLLSADRIALDCYQAAYTGLGAARSIPSPPPFVYMATGFTPSTFRRGVRLSRLGKLANPFPIIELPYHRLMNPWTLGAIHHEVSHNIQSDLGLWEEVPRRIHERLRQAGMPQAVTQTWVRWHKETWADLNGLLLGGPAVVASLLDVVARTPRLTTGYDPAGVHPTPYLRVFISLELLRRMGFPQAAEHYRQVWNRLYPKPWSSRIPRPMLETFDRANQLVVDTICYQPYPQLGGKRLADVSSFKPAHQEMVAEAGGRLAAGTDPGIIPARFLVGAARWALDNDLAPPRQITLNFYQALGNR